MAAEIGPNDPGGLVPREKVRQLQRRLSGRGQAGSGASPIESAAVPNLPDAVQIGTNGWACRGITLARLAGVWQAAPHERRATATSKAASHPPAPGKAWGVQGKRRRGRLLAQTRPRPRTDEEGPGSSPKSGQEFTEIIQPQPGVATNVRFYVSSHKRTLQTCEEIAAVLRRRDGVTLLRTYFDPRLREQDFGNLEDSEVMVELKEARKAFGSFHYRFKDGESGADVYDRISLVLDTMHRDWEESTPENVVVVSHGITMRAFLMRWFNWPPEEFERLRNFENCAIVVMKRQGDGRFVLKTRLQHVTEEAASPAYVRASVLAPTTVGRPRRLAVSASIRCAPRDVQLQRGGLVRIGSNSWHRPHASRVRRWLSRSRYRAASERHVHTARRRRRHD